MVLDVLCDTINLVFRFMDSNLRICCRNSVDLAIDLLFFKDGSLPDTDSELGLSGRLVSGDEFFFELAFFDHELEVDVDVFARSQIQGFFLLFLLFGCFHILPTLFSLLFYFLNRFHASFNLRE